MALDCSDGGAGHLSSIVTSSVDAAIRYDGAHAMHVEHDSAIDGLGANRSLLRYEKNDPGRQIAQSEWRRYILALGQMKLSRLARGAVNDRKRITA